MAQSAPGIGTRESAEDGEEDGSRLHVECLSRYSVQDGGSGDRAAKHFRSICRDIVRTCLDQSTSHSPARPVDQAIVDACSELGWSTIREERLLSSEEER